jgi:3-methylfumaryl-CoA hydratase
MTGVPPEFRHVLDTWHPEPEVVEDELGVWPAQALAALLGAPPPSVGDPLPPLWHEVYLHRPLSLDELAPDGHPVGGALLPPLPERRRMFGGGRVRVEAPLRVGERARRTSSVLDVRVREGRSGWLLLVTELHMLDVAGARRVREERDIVYRLPADVRAGPRSPGPTQAQALPDAAADPRAGSIPAPAPAFRLDVDERFLFLFSALTYNPHRIHYDRDHTVAEGHRDLLVHGPLLALGAIEAARRLSAEAITALSYRLVSPAYPGTPIEFSAREAPATTVVGTQNGKPKIEATVTR